jgi:DNA adenine methylase
MSTITRPALRYHGGKFRLTPWVLQFFPPHKAYAEPFGGGASVLLLKPRCAAECYNDLDGRVVGFFRVLRDPHKAAELQRRVSLTPYARAELEWAMLDEATDEIDAAHRLVVRSFMGHGSDSATRTTRTGFRARLTEGRALPSSEWSTWSDSIPLFRDRLSGVLLDNDDALPVIKRMDHQNTLIYCDPPYVHATRSAIMNRRSGTNGYAHELDDAGHVALATALQAVKAMVVVSGYPSALYEDLYAGWERHERSHTADGGKARTEVVWLNPACSSALRSRAGLFSESTA